MGLASLAVPCKENWEMVPGVLAWESGLRSSMVCSPKRSQSAQARSVTPFSINCMDVCLFGQVWAAGLECHPRILSMSFESGTLNGLGTHQLGHAT